MIKEAWNYIPDSEWAINPEEGKKSRSKIPDNTKKWDYLVPKREMNHIEKHIKRAERARGLRDHKYRLLPQRIPSGTLSPKPLIPEDEKNKTIQKTHKTVPKKPEVAWAKEQMRRHKGRMVQARELTEQKEEQRKTQKLPSRIRPLLKPQVKEEEKELEKVTAYPIFQPSKEKLIEVTILMEKSKADEVPKPRQRELLRMPLFLKHQLAREKKA